MRSTALSLAATLLGILACSNDESANFQISAIAESNGQSSRVGTAVPIQPQVLVEVDGEPEEGVTVNWNPKAGGVSGATSVTDADGIARIVWVLGSSPGLQALLASVEGGDPSRLTFTATATAPVIDIEIVAETDSQSGTVGEPLDEELAVRVTLDGVATEGVEIKWYTEAGTISVSSLTDEDGIARTSWTMPAEPGTVNALAYHTAGSVLTFTEFTATAVAVPGARGYPRR